MRLSLEKRFGKPDLVLKKCKIVFSIFVKFLKRKIVKGRILSNTDIEHYQKIIVALAETGRVMEEIGKIEYE